jgi:hypothetical protein
MTIIDESIVNSEGSQNMNKSSNSHQENIKTENWFAKHLWEIITATIAGAIVLFIGIFLKYKFGL